MAFQTFNGGFIWPDPQFGQDFGNSPATSELTIDASGEKVGFVFVAPKTGNIDLAAWYVKSKTTNGTLDLTMETVDAATGLPSGTLIATNTSGSFSNTSADQACAVTLTAVAAVTKGTQYAMVISQNAGNCTIQLFNPNLRFGSKLTYPLHYTGGAWSATSAAPARTLAPNIGLRYDDGAYYYIPGVMCFSTTALTTFNNTTATRERGLAFTLPFPGRVTGFFLIGSVNLSDYEVILATTDGTARLTFGGDKDLNSRYGNYNGALQGYFSSTYDLAAATKYYLTLKPTSASNVSLREVTIIDATVPAQMGMLNGGTAAYLVTRDSGGAYTETTSQRPYGMGIVVSGFDDGAGGAGGGMILPRSQNGGLV